MTSELVERLEGLLAKATPGNLATAERHLEREVVECPFCGEGEIETSDYCNFDGAALGVQFYGIGQEFGAHERLWRETMSALPQLLAIAKASQALAAKLEAIHADSAYQSVWTVNQIHAGLYRGPQSDAELAALNGALAEDRPRHPEPEPS